MGRNGVRNNESPQGSLQVANSDSTYAMGTWERYLLIAWRSEVTSHGVMTWSRLLGEARSTAPTRRVGVLALVEPECVFPAPQPIAQGFVEGMKRYHEIMAGMAVIYNREGFWGAALRGRMTAVHTASGTDVPYAVCNDAESACAWLVEATGDPPARAEDLARALDELCAMAAAS